MRKRAKRIFVEKWLTQHHDILKIKPLELKLGFHLGAIQKFLKENRSLSDERINVIYDFITDGICENTNN
ncbi:hypothetical protein [Aquimarina rhabdastrellae]